MKPATQTVSVETAQKIDQLVRTLRDTERRLHALTGGQLDIVTSEGGQPYLLHEAQEKLRHSETALRQLSETQGAILDALPAHVALVDSQGLIVSVNEAWRRFAGANALLGLGFGVGQNYIALCETAQGDGAGQARQVAAGLRGILSGSAREFALDYPCHSPAEKRWFRLTATPLHEGQPGGAVVMHVNITERILAEERLVRINRLYAVLSRVNETIVRTRDRQELFEMVCRIAVEQGLFRMAAVLELDAATGTVRPLAHAGAEDGYFSEVSINMLDPRFNRGTVGTAIRTKVFNVSNDMLNDPRLDAWKESYARRGYRSAGSFPIIIESRVMGVLMLFANEVNYFHADEIELLTAVQKNLSFAVGALHQEEQRRQAEAALREQTLLLDNAQRIGRMGSWSLDVRRNRLIWSEATCRLFGITRAEFRGTFEFFYRFILPEDVPAYNAVHARVSPTQPLLEAEYRIRRPDGAVRWMYERGNVEFDAAGAAVSRVGMVMDVTEQRAAREQLEQGAALLRIAGRAARLGAWTIELPERKLTWSDETCVIHDCPPGYRPTLEEGLSLFPPEHRAEVARLVDACARDGTPYDFEVAKMTATGRRIWVRSIGEAVRDAEGNIIRLQGAFQDITERKLAELELARSNRALRMLSAGGEVLIHANEETSLLAKICALAVELGGYRMAWVGYAREDHAIEPMAHAGVEQGYLSIARVNWSADDPAGRGPAGHAIRTGQLAVCADVANEENFIHWRDEALARGYKSIICLPLREERRTFGLLGLYSGDVSQPGADELKLLQELADDLAFGIVSLRARAERRKVESEMAQKAALLDLATDAIIVRDLEGDISFWNKSAERIYGWKAGEAIGRSTRDFLFTDPFGFKTAMQALLKNGEWTGELQKKNKAGQALTVDCRWTLVRDEQGKPAAVLCIETDVTEKKKLETQFLRSQRMESLGTLAGGIAHDLNNVLTPIMIAVQMLREQAKDAETLKLLDTLETCSQRGADLVKQVLVFGRGIEGQRIPVTLSWLIRELQQIMREVFPKNIELAIAAARDSWDVIGDPTQLQQVFLNLCVNARDAMPHGGKLTIATQNVVLDEAHVQLNPDTKAGTYVMVSVTDSGIGIPPAIRERIFEPFFTTKEVGKGTGLGLSTVLGIVKSHDGFINVYSEPGQGSSFKVYLPASTSPNAADSAAVKPSGLPGGHGELILLVDDEQGVRNVAQRILERFGYRILPAANGADAIAIYKKHQPQIALVLTDMSMPVMDGPALILALKAVNPAVRVIASSGLRNDGGMAKAVDAGALRFIPKPYTAETLLNALHEELARPENPTKS